MITLSEYHLLTGDKSVLPGIRTYATALARGQDTGGIWGHRMATRKRNGRLPGYGLETGHASTWFNPFWTPLGANLSGPEVTQRFFRESLWLQTLYRSWDGSFSRYGRNSKEGPQAGAALLAYCLARKALYVKGSNLERQTAVGYFGWGCPKETALAHLDEVGSVLRNQKEDPWVRAAAASVLCLYGEPVQKYYWDMVKLAAEDKPGDPFGDIDWSVGASINKTCADPFEAGLVKDKALHYEVALKLADNKRQHVRADGLRMLAGMPLEDFHLMADKVMYVIEDKSPRKLMTFEEAKRAGEE